VPGVEASSRLAIVNSGPFQVGKVAPGLWVLINSL